VVQREELVARAPELSDESVTSVRVIYPDLHGVALEHHLRYWAQPEGVVCS
jgi:hypothetical protein